MKHQLPKWKDLSVDEAGTELALEGEAVLPGEPQLLKRQKLLPPKPKTEEVSLDELFTLKPEILVAGATWQRKRKKDPTTGCQGQEEEKEEIRRSGI